uniref:Trihelix transcription factor GTL1 n=1 Tax=Anthurium amnicola TaxID=1678845 RepID=A0A1D1YXV9_9ARAE
MQQGGSQYGAPPPDMTSFASGTGNRAHVLGAPGSEHLQQQPLAEVASPISSRPPPRASNFDELASPALGGCPDEDALAAAGEEAERGVVPGNRWPRQETLALLKIRSEMDTTFRDATLKAPLWEDVSR